MSSTETSSLAEL